MKSLRQGLYSSQIQLAHLLAPFPFRRVLIPLDVALLRLVPFPLARMKNSLRILCHFHLRIVLDAAQPCGIRFVALLALNAPEILQAARLFQTFAVPAGEKIIGQQQRGKHEHGSHVRHSFSDSAIEF